MKKRKLLCLLALMMCVTAPLAACGDGDSSGESSDFDKYFYWDDDREAYSQVVRYDGEVGDVDTEHNLAVIYSQKTNNDGVTTKYEVVNLLTGKVVRTETLTNSTGSTEKTLSVDISYPVVRVVRSTLQGDEREYQYSYYLAKDGDGSGYGSDKTVLAENMESDSLNVQTIGSLYKIGWADEEVWVNSDLEILRAFADVQTNGYQTPVISGAYGDYLYSWSFNETNHEIQVFNKEGVCSMQYKYPSDVVSLGYIGDPVILNNGNILVQEHTLAEADATDYTYEMVTGYDGEAEKVDVVSKIIDYKTGEVREVKLDYVILWMQAAYEEEQGGYFPFQVRETAQNQAYIAKITNKKISTIDYVTLDNEGTIGYTVKNDKLKEQSGLRTGIVWNRVSAVNDKYYQATVTANGGRQIWIFDKNGNKVVEMPDTWSWNDYYNGKNALTDNYIVTNYGIYNYNRTCVYDFTKSELVDSENEEMSLLVNANELYLSKVNTKTQQVTLYKFNGTTFAKVEKDSAEIELSWDDVLPNGNKATVTVDMTKENSSSIANGQYTWTLYSAQNQALLKMQVNTSELTYSSLWFKQCDDVAYVETATLDGDPIVYVLK